MTNNITTRHRDGYLGNLDLKEEPSTNSNEFYDQNDLVVDDVNLSGSFEDYFQHLNSFLKFDSPDKWLSSKSIEENNENEISPRKKFLSSITEVEEESTAEEGESNVEDDSNVDDGSSVDEYACQYFNPITDCFVPEKSLKMYSSSNGSSNKSSDPDIVLQQSTSGASVDNTISNSLEHNNGDQEDARSSHSGRKNRRLTCEEFIFHLQNSRESCSLSLDSQVNFDGSSEESLKMESSCYGEGLESSYKILEKKRLKVIEEMIYTEGTYFHHLELIVFLFLEPLHDLKILPESVIYGIFGNIQLIMAVNMELSSHISTKSMGQAFLFMAPFLKLYSTYAKNHEKALALLLEWDQKSPEFSKFRRRQEDLPEMKGLKLNALLITPVQRVPRYKLLLEQLLKYTSENHEDYNDLMAAINEVNLVANHINEHIKQQDNFMRMLAIQKSFSGGPRILVPGRVLIKEGTLRKVSSHAKKSHDRLFFLFSDVLMYAKSRFLDASSYTNQYNSLTCCCVLPLHHCCVEQVFGSNHAQGSLFTIKCKGQTLLLFSDQKTVSCWISTLKKQIEELKMNRQSLRKKSSAMQPTRYDGISRFLRKQDASVCLQSNLSQTPEKLKKERRNLCKTLQQEQNFTKSPVYGDSPRSNLSKKINNLNNSQKSDISQKKRQATPKKNFVTGFACLRKSKKKLSYDELIPEKPKVFADYTILEQSVFSGNINITLNDSIDGHLDDARSFSSTSNNSIVSNNSAVIDSKSISSTESATSVSSHWCKYSGTNMPSTVELLSPITSNNQDTDGECSIKTISHNDSDTFNLSKHSTHLEGHPETPPSSIHITIRKSSKLLRPLFDSPVTNGHQNNYILSRNSTFKQPLLEF